MVIKLSKNVTKQDVEQAMAKLKKKKQAKDNTTAQSFGSLKRGLDGLEYQKAVRDEWS